MSNSYLNSFPMERVTAINTFPLFRVLLISFVQVFLLHEIAHLFGRVYKFLSRSPSQYSEVSDEKKQKLNNSLHEKEVIEEDGISSNDFVQVIAKLGIYLDPKGEKLGLDDDFSNLFEEKEPSLEEVKGAFDVFDQNRDGFVDEMELQGVLCNLGLKEGLDVQNCRRMIARYDENGDGRIDFKEFVKMMENTFC